MKRKLKFLCMGKIMSSEIGGYSQIRYDNFCILYIFFCIILYLICYINFDIYFLIYIILIYSYYIIFLLYFNFFYIIFNIIRCKIEQGKLVVWSWEGDEIMKSMKHWFGSSSRLSQEKWKKVWFENHVRFSLFTNKKKACMTK